MSLIKLDDLCLAQEVGYLQAFQEAVNNQINEIRSHYEAYFNLHSTYGDPNNPNPNPDEYMIVQSYKSIKELIDSAYQLIDKAADPTTFSASSHGG